MDLRGSPLTTRASQALSRGHSYHIDCGGMVMVCGNRVVLVVVVSAIMGGGRMLHEGSVIVPIGVHYSWLT